MASGTPAPLSFPPHAQQPCPWVMTMSDDLNGPNSGVNFSTYFGETISIDTTTEATPVQRPNTA